MSTGTILMTRKLAIVAGLALVYFQLFPDDLDGVATSLEGYLKLLRSILELTGAIAPALYAVAGTVVLGWAANGVTRQILASRVRRTPTGEPESKAI